MLQLREAVLGVLMGIGALGAVPTAAIAHGEVVREYHSYTYRENDDDDDDDWRDHRRYRSYYEEDAPVVYRRSYYYEGRPRHERRDYYDCRTSGTTGTIIGGALGALIGRGVDRYGDRAAGTIIGAGGGALIGHEIDSKHRC